MQTTPAAAAATSATATPTPPRATPTDRFRDHIGSAWAHTSKAALDSLFLPDYAQPSDVRSAVRHATIADGRIQKALYLGYLGSDDAGTYAFEAQETIRAGVEHLRPFAASGVAWKPGTPPAGLEQAMTGARATFKQATASIAEALTALG